MMLCYKKAVLPRVRSIGGGTAETGDRAVCLSADATVLAEIGIYSKAVCFHFQNNFPDIFIAIVQTIEKLGKNKQHQVLGIGW